MNLTVRNPDGITPEEARALVDRVVDREEAAFPSAIGFVADSLSAVQPVSYFEREALR